jgi:hypothetical protein
MYSLGAILGFFVAYIEAQYLIYSTALLTIVSLTVYIIKELNMMRHIRSGASKAYN